MTEKRAQNMRIHLARVAITHEKKKEIASLSVKRLERNRQRKKDLN